jgi:hypothetical protein
MAKIFYRMLSHGKKYLLQAESSTKIIYHGLSHQQKLFLHAKSLAKNAQHAHSACSASRRANYQTFWDG